MLRHHTWIAAYLIVLMAADLGFAQTSEPKPAVANTAPRLSAEQRRAFAQAEVLVRQDPEYKSAVQRVIDAQKAADGIYFAKIRKAMPELGPYLDFLEKARNPAPSTPQQ